MRSSARRSKKRKSSVTKSAPRWQSARRQKHARKSSGKQRLRSARQKRQRRQRKRRNPLPLRQRRARSCAANRRRCRCVKSLAKASSRDLGFSAHRTSLSEMPPRRSSGRRTMQRERRGFRLSTETCAPKHRSRSSTRDRSSWQRAAKDPKVLRPDRCCLERQVAETIDHHSKKRRRCSYSLSVSRSCSRCRNRSSFHGTSAISSSTRTRSLRSTRCSPRS